MDERYTHSIVNSTSEYLDRLQYLAQASPIDVKDIMILDIIHHVYSWADWFELTETTKIILQSKMEELIFSNSNLILPRVIDYKYYFNVSIPQTIWTWQRVYDNLLEHTFETLNIVGATTIYDEDGFYLLDEDGNILQFETP